MKYLFYVLLTIFLIKVYDRFFLKMQIKKALKNKKISYVDYNKYSLIDVNDRIEDKFKIEKIVFDSKIIPEKMAYTIIFPLDFDKNKEYSIVYMLHGLRDSAFSWIEKAELDRIYYSLLKNNEVNSMIIVLPESGYEGRSWYSNWVEDEERKYETYFIEELIPKAENGLKIKSRGICGFSMGGYGAMKLSLKNLDKFQSVSSLAGAINFPRFFIAELKGLGIFKHMKVSRFMTKSEDSKHFARVFGGKMKFFRNENVYNILRKVCRHKLEEIKKVSYLLSVGEKDNTFYTMLYQWTDVVGEMEKRDLDYKGRLVKNEEHTWDYVKKELPSILRFHSKTLSKESTKYE